jgi:DNA-binding NtrC family response regulator
MTTARIGQSGESPRPSKPAHVLVVDDEESICSSLARFLPTCGYQVQVALNAQEALKLREQYAFDVLLTDLRLPDMDGITLGGQFKAQDPDVIVILMTAFGTIESAVEAMRAGVDDYLVKPFRTIDNVHHKLALALEHRRLTRENVVLREEKRALLGQVRTKYKFENIVGHSEPMQEVFRLIEKVADSDSTILILGDSGTGKELVARAIHYNSRRHNHPLVAVNCGAIPSELLESELFGHMKGSFTGAVSSRIGRFQLADGGTIFLDEIGDMLPSLQVKILRVLQEREFDPVGATKPVKVNVRVIAATNQNLEKAVRDKRFREDLYYRLNVIRIPLPPLRERREDIHVLAQHFLEFYNREKEKAVKGFSEETLRIMDEYDWPGNVRELENTIERIVIMKGEGEVTPEDLSDRMRRSKARPCASFKIDIPPSGISFYDLVQNFENDLIVQALEKTRWNKNKAAALLRLNRTTLVEKIKKKQLDRLGPADE